MSDIFYVKKLDCKMDGIKLPPYQKQEIVWSHPFSAMFIGASGSGKTTCLIYTLKNLYKDFFKEIHLISPTGVSDDMFNHLKIPKKNICTSGFVTYLNKLLKNRQRLCEEKGKANTPPLLLILEDATSNKKLMNSQALIECYTMLRHYNCSVIMCIHKYRLGGNQRICRNNSNGFIIFPLANNKEVEILADELGIPNKTKQEKIKIIRQAWTVCDKIPRPFLFINKKDKPERAYRRAFVNVINYK